MKFGLEVQVIENIISVLEQHPKVDKAFVFGSRAKGNYRPDSDIDIAIKGNEITTDDIITISVAIEAKGVTHKFDLIDYNNIKEPALKEHIDRVGIEFYSRWKKYRFSDFVLINPTVSLKGDKEYSFVEMKDLQDGNKVCSPSAIRKTSSGARFQEMDTLFARITPCLENGKICQVRDLENGIGFGSTEFLVFRGKENVSDNEFVFYLSRWDEVRDFAENNFEGTSGRQRVPKNCFYNLKLYLPPLPEQIAIASILSSLDDKIDLLHRQNKTLEQLTETLFRQWFVEESEESWETKTLGELLSITSSKRIYYSEYVLTGIPFYRSKEIIELRKTGSTNSELFISNERFNEINNKFGSPKEGDILMTSVGTLGVAYRVRKSDNFYFKDGNLTWFKDFKGLPSSIVYLWLISKIGQEELAAITIGSTQEALTIEGLKSISFKIPPTEKIKIYELEFNSIIYKIESNQTQIRTLTQTRDTLLPKLMSGEVRVKM
ncbi:MAG: restriction endonuclease subunit S [Bacteroides sp.]|uniref:restriction endonuclease subunit S n=1 Tax=Bacteroides sp. TaxID=29523 RepID=UPI001B6543DC|nr:restriction endonuclease subunit S [Bacteroides sp.]MBP9587350.1 restriction endonuclease subunit S [Bacteroides sp.]